MASLITTAPDQELIAPESGEHEALEALSKLLGSDEQTPLRLVAADGSEIELPNSLRRVLERASRALANAQSIAVEPYERFVSVTEAALLLNIPPRAVMSVVDRKELTTIMIDGRQMLDIDDVRTWGAHHHARMLQGLDELAEMSQEMGLYDIDRS